MENTQTELAQSLLEKLVQIANIIKSTQEEDAAISDILLEGYSLSLRAIEHFKINNSRSQYDISEQLEFVTKILGVDLKDLIMHVVEQEFPAGPATILDTDDRGGNAQTLGEMISKQADAETLDFITSDLEVDEYEKFLQQSKAKESLDFLKKQI